MSFQDELLTIGKQKINEFKAYVNELEVQLALGKAEARDAFLKEKKNFARFLDDQKQFLNDKKANQTTLKNTLNTAFENLAERLVDLEDDTREAFDEQKKNILEKIYELEAVIKDTYGDLDKELQVQLDTFKGKLDAYRVQLALGKYEVQDLLETKKAELREAVSNLRRQMVEEEQAKGKLEVVSQELNASFDHLKKAFSEIFD